MKKALFSILLCTVLLAMLTGPVSAKGVIRTPYTGIENPTYCADPSVDPRCALGAPGETRTLPNGKSITIGVVWVIQFVSAEPRFNGVTIARVNILPGPNNRTLIIGKWRLEPDGYDGYWEGPVTITADETGFHSKYGGKGYGDLKGLTIKGINDNGNLSGEIFDPGGKAWPRPATTPESQGIDSNDLIGMLDWIEEDLLDVHSILVMRHNKVVMEVYYPPFNRDDRHLQFSATKSFVSALVGIAVSEGKIQSVDQPFLDYFTDIPVQNLSPWKESITILHLLNMTSGLEVDDNRLGEGIDTVSEAVNKPSLKEPGAVFEYNPVNSVLLAAIVEKATGMHMADYARKKLFTPLGIMNVYWASDSKGVTLGNVGLLLTPREMLKFGMLYNQGGVWQGKQVVPADWVAATLVMNDKAYGYHWWQGFDGIGAAGYSGQRIFVFPQRDIIIVITGEFAEEWYGDLLACTPMFAIRSDEALPESEASTVLAERIWAIEHPQAQPIPPLPQMVKTVSGKTFRLSENALGWQTINLSFKNKYAQLEITTKSSAYKKKFLIGLDEIYRGTRQKAVTRLAVPVPPQRYVLNPYEFNFILGIPINGTVWMKGAWTSQENFSLTVQDSRDFEKDTLTFHFSPPAVTIDWYSAREMKTQMLFEGQIIK